MYETLVTREEMAYAEDIGDYYRIPMDARDLNYAVTAEARKGCGEQEFNSDVTRRLNVDEMVELLRKAVTLNE